MDLRRLILAATALSACGGGSSYNADDYVQLRVGNSWEYAEFVIDAAGVEDESLRASKTKEVAERENYDNRETYVWVTNETDSDTTKRSNWYDDGTRVERLVQKAYDADGNLTGSRLYDPGFLRFDRTLDEVGENISEVHERTELDGSDNLRERATKEYDWIVEAVGEEITVPAGTFECIRVSRTEIGDGTQVISWWAKGVGKIREEAPFQFVPNDPNPRFEIEELEDYQVEP